MKGKFDFSFEVNEDGGLGKLLRITNNSGTTLDVGQFDPSLMRFIKGRQDNFQYTEYSGVHTQKCKKVGELGETKHQPPSITISYKFSYSDNR